MVRKRFPKLKLAEQALARAQVAALDGTYVFRGDAKMTLAEYAPTWLASLRVEHNTMAGYRTYLKCQVLPHLGGRAMSSLRRSDINAFVGTLVNKGLAPRTVRHIYALLAMMLRSGLRPAAHRDALLQDQPPGHPAVEAVDPHARAGHRAAARGTARPLRDPRPRRRHRHAPGRDPRRPPARRELPPP